MFLKKSNINGKGVFASCDFNKGDIVLHWNISITLSKDEFENSSEQEKKYICLLDNKYIVMQEPEKYVNHSCSGNVTSSKFCDVANRKILKGEEITGNYNETGSFKFKCNCGSSNCYENEK